MANLSYHVDYSKVRTCWNCQAPQSFFYVDHNEGQETCTKCARVQETRKICTLGPSRIHGGGYQAQTDIIGGGNIGNGYTRGNSGKASNDRLTNNRFAQRINRMNKRLRPPKEQSMRVQKAAIKKLCDALGLKKMVENHAISYLNLYRSRVHLFNPKVIKKTKVLAGACIIQATRDLNVARTFREFAKTGLVKETSLSKGLRELKSMVPIGNAQTILSTLVPRYAQMVGCTHDMKQCSIRLCNQITKNHILESRAHVSVLSAIFYISLRCYCVRLLSPEDIAKRLDIANNTTRDVIEDLLKQKPILIEGLKLKEKKGFFEWIQEMN